MMIELPGIFGSSNRGGRLIILAVGVTKCGGSGVRIAISYFIFSTQGGYMTTHKNNMIKKYLKC